MIIAAQVVLTMVVAVPAPSSAVTAEAKRLFRAGAAAYEAGRYLAAAQALEQSYQILPLPAVAFSLAQAYRLQFFVDRDSRHLERAIAHYQVYLEQTPNGGRRADAAGSLAELGPMKARLELDQRNPLRQPEPAYEPPTQLMVISPVAGAVATLNGGPTGPVPLVVEVSPGRHVATVTADGYEPAEQSTVAVKGRLVVIEVELAERPARVSLRGDAGARVWVDGRLSAQLPLQAPLTLTPGRHHLTVSKDGYLPWVRSVRVERGGAVALEAQLELTVQREVSYYVMGAGGLTIGAAAVLGIMALRDDQRATLLLDKREVEGLTLGELSEYERLAVRRGGRSATAWVLFGVGATVGLSGGLLYYLDRPRAVRAPDDAVIGISPVIGDGGGVMVSGRF